MLQGRVTMLARLYRSEHTARDRPTCWRAPSLAEVVCKSTRMTCIVEMPPRDRSTGRLEGWTDRGTTGDDIACARVRGSWLARRRQASRLPVVFASQFRVLWYCLKQYSTGNCDGGSSFLACSARAGAKLPARTSEARPATCDLRPATCDLRPATCDLRPATFRFLYAPC
jgi:hypothetical protein